MQGGGGGCGTRMFPLMKLSPVNFEPAPEAALMVSCRDRCAPSLFTLNPPNSSPDELYDRRLRAIFDASRKPTRISVTYLHNPECVYQRKSYFIPPPPHRSINNTQQSRKRKKRGLDAP